MPTAQFERGLIRTVDTMMVKNKPKTPKAIRVPFLFNPAELTIAKTNDFKTPQADKKASKKELEFGGGQPRQITLQLFFDTYEKHHAQQLMGRHPDVREYTDKLAELMQVQKELDGWPPKVQLEWGNLQRGWVFPFYITSMTQKFLLFTPAGTPVRATVDITGKSDYDGALGAQNPTSGGEGDERVRLVRPGERLDLIAYEEYGDSSLWRVIASANQLTSPRELIVGQRLAIPPRP